MIVIFLFTFFTLGSSDILIFLFWPQNIFAFVLWPLIFSLLGPKTFYICINTLTLSNIIFLDQTQFFQQCYEFHEEHPNSNYDRINSKFNKKIGISKTYAWLNEKTHKKHTIKNKQTRIKWKITSHFLKKLKKENDETAPNWRIYFQTALRIQALIQHDAIQAMNAWFKSFQMQIQEHQCWPSKNTRTEKQKRWKR